MFKRLKDTGKCKVIVIYLFYSIVYFFPVIFDRNQSFPNRIQSELFIY